MTLLAKNVIAEGQTHHPHEREAIEFLKRELPDTEWCRLWGLVELTGRDGRLYEIDALVLGFHALYLVEIKSHPAASVSGDTLDWTFHWPDGRASTVQNPKTLAAHKSRVLASMLEGVMGQSRPWVEPLIFLSAEGVKKDLMGAAGANVCTRKTLVNAIAIGDVPVSGDRIRERSRLTGQQIADTIKALQQLGIGPSKGALRLGELALGEILDEGPGYQDREGKHDTLPQMNRRVRLYLVQQSQTPEQRLQRRKAAEREARVLTQLGDHRNMLRVFGYTASGPIGGPCIEFERFESGEPLDAFLRRNPGLTFEQKTSILEQLAEALEFCHRKGVFHRGLHPGAVLVRFRPEPGDEQKVPSERMVEIRLLNFQLAFETDGSQGTVHLSALSGDPAALYRAPELSEDPRNATAASDVFSLGAVAWHILVGRPPGTNVAERKKLLDAGGGMLSVAAASDALAGVGDEQRASIDEVVGMATAANVHERADSAIAWMNLLLDAATQPAAEPKPNLDPLQARPGDTLGQALEVEKILGSGSTAKVLLVKRDDSRFALKVPLSAELHDRVAMEAAALERLHSDRIVPLVDRLTLAGRPCLLLGYAGESLSQLLAREGPVSLDYARRWGEDLLRAVEELEEQGVQHRDIKPGNLGIATGESKKTRRLRLFDFSLSGAVGLEIGTAVYRDPFLIERSHWDQAADRWSAAITLHEMLTGVRPRFGEGDVSAVAIADEITLEGERFDASVRDRLLAFFRKALARKVDARHTSADEMRLGWLACFAAPKVEREGAEADDTTEHRPVDPATLDGVTAGTAIGALPLSPRALNALERAGVVTAGELVKLPDNQLSAMRGVGRETGREIVALLGLLKQRLSIVEEAPRFWSGFAPAEALSSVPGLKPDALARLEDAGLTKVDQLAADSSERVTRILTPFTGAAEAIRKHLEEEAQREARAGRPTTIEAWVEALLPATGKRAKTFKHIRELFGLDPVQGKRYGDVPALAEALAQTPQSLYIALRKARERWAEHPRLDDLRARVIASLEASGDVTSLAHLGRDLGLVLPHEASVGPGILNGSRNLGAATDDAERCEQALVRVICELARTDDGAQSSDGPVFFRIRQTPWVAGSDVLAQAAEELGKLADALAQRTPLPSSETVREELAKKTLGTPLEGRPNDELVALAAEASVNAARSARLELYPKGMDYRRALALSHSALANGELGIAEVQRLVRARYPEATPVPSRPELDELLAPLKLRFDTETATYRREDAGPPTTSHTKALGDRRSTQHTSSGSAGKPRSPPTPEESEAKDFDQRLRLAAEKKYFRVFDAVAPYADDAAREIGRRLGVEPILLDQALIEAAMAKARTLEIDPAVIFDADRAGPGSPNWDKLCDLMRLAAKDLAETLRRSPHQRVLSRPGLLARYGLDGLLRTLVEAAQADDAPALFLVNPIQDAAGPQPIAGRGTSLQIPTTSPAQRARVPESWLLNQHRGRE